MRGLLVAGVLIVIITSFSVGKAMEIYDVGARGKIVKMRIDDLPSSCPGAKVQYFITLNYNGNIYRKATIGAFCEQHHIGEFIDMKMLNGSQDILFPHESGLLNLLSLIALGLFGLILSIVQIKKIRNKK